jgi:hypothetical protein
MTEIGLDVAAIKNTNKKSRSTVLFELFRNNQFANIRFIYTLCSTNAYAVVSGITPAARALACRMQHLRRAPMAAVRRKIKGGQGARVLICSIPAFLIPVLYFTSFAGHYSWDAAMV